MQTFGRILLLLLCLMSPIAAGAQIYTAGDTINLKFTTAVAGVPTQLAGTPVVSIYKQGSLTESTTGVTLTPDYDSRTGLNDVSVTTAADASFYSNGSTFQFVVTTGTVGGNSYVGTVVGDFRLTALASINIAAGIVESNTKQLDGSATAVTNLKNEYQTGAPRLLVADTVGTVTSPTEIIGNIPTSVNSVRPGDLIIFYDASNGNAPSARRIVSYEQTTPVVIIDSATSFTLAQNDSYKIFAIPTQLPGTGVVAKAGDAMALLDDAITSGKFDESTAYPIKSADTGSTQILRKGASAVDGTTITSAVGAAAASVHNQDPVESLTAKLGTRSDGVFKASRTLSLAPGEITQIWIDCSRRVSINLADAENAASTNANITVTSLGVYGKSVSLIVDTTAAAAGNTATLTCDATPRGAQKMKVAVDIVIDAD